MMNLENMNIEEIPIEVSLQFEEPLLHSFAWNHKNTILFLNEFKKRFEEFKDPMKKKKEIWENIASEMKLHGYNVTGNMLDKKLRNMKGTFRLILDNNRKGGKCSVKWKYFDIFQDIFQINTTKYNVDKCEEIIEFNEQDLQLIDASELMSAHANIFTWDSENTFVFLEKLKKIYDEFKNPNKRKKDVWECIAREMREENYDVTSEMLDRKFRNMKVTYKSIVDKGKIGSVKSRWEFFDDFHELFQHDALEDEETSEIYLNLNDDSTLDLSNNSPHFVWTHKATMALLQHFKMKYDLYKDPKIKKKGIWAAIAVEMRLQGYDVTAEMIDRKYRNMKITYRTVLENNKNTTKGSRIKWRYFQYFHDIFQNDRQILYEKRYEDNRKLLKLEEKKLVELRKLREAIEESNKISLERIRLLKESLKNV